MPYDNVAHDKKALTQRAYTSDFRPVSTSEVSVHGTNRLRDNYPFNMVRGTEPKKLVRVHASSGTTGADRGRL